MRLRNILRISIFGISLFSTLVTAADSCVWSRQPDGSQWGTCVDDRGRTYCMSCKSGACSRVSCR